MGIRRWLSGTLRPDKVETDSLSTNSATIGGDPVGGFGETNAPTPGFDNWITADANSPSLLIIDILVETDGSAAGQVEIAVDESGGTSQDYDLVCGFIEPVLPDGTQSRETTTFYVPAGGQYNIQNIQDPNNANLIVDLRELTLSQS